MKHDEIEAIAIHLKDNEREPWRRKNWTIQRYKQTVYNRINLGWPATELRRPIDYARRSMPMVKACYAYEAKPTGKLTPRETKQRLAVMWRHSRAVMRRELARLGINWKQVPAMDLLRQVVATYGWPPHKGAAITVTNGAIRWTTAGVKGPLWKAAHSQSPHK